MIYELNRRIIKLMIEGAALSILTLSRPLNTVEIIDMDIEVVELQHSPLAIKSSAEDRPWISVL